MIMRQPILRLEIFVLSCKENSHQFYLTLFQFRERDEAELC